MYVPSAAFSMPDSSSASISTVTIPSVETFLVRHTVTVPLFSLTVMSMVLKSIPTTDVCMVCMVCVCVCVCEREREREKRESKP